MTPAQGPAVAPSPVQAIVLAAGLAAIGLLAFQVLQPFLVAFLWALVLVVSSWPGLIWLQDHLGGRRWLAITLLMLALLLLVVAPLTLAITAAVANAGEIAERAKTLADWRLPSPPEWLTTLPFVGNKILLLWEQVASAGIDGVFAQLAPYAGAVTKRFLAEARGLGFLLLQFLLMLAFAALIFARGEAAGEFLRSIGRRLGGERGDEAVLLANRAIRGVAFGVGGTAVLQSLLASIGLALAGVPFVALLTTLTFVLCLVQLGTPLVMGPAVAWLYWSGETGWGNALLVWALLIGTSDNLIRPLLIRRGVDLPFWMVFTGVIGGLLAFGLVGLFIGPVVLAVAHRLLDHWLADLPPPSIEGAEAVSPDTPPPR